METKTRQKWTDVKDRIYGLMVCAGLDIENNKLNQTLFDYICREIDEKVESVWRAEEFMRKIRETK